MRIAVIAGPDAGHAIPAIALSRRLSSAGDSVVVYTGQRWCGAAGDVPGLEMALLPGLDVLDTDDDSDAGARLGLRAARMCSSLVPVLAAAQVDLVVSDVITVAGGWAAERLGVPWIELSPHPLYEPSVGLPPIGSGMAPGTGLRGRLRDRLMRAATARSRSLGEQQRGRARQSIGLGAIGPGPTARFIATLPALEVPRPDWPAHAHVIGPLLWEPTDEVVDPPAGPGPLVVVAPSTAATGVGELAETALAALDPRATGRSVRVVISALQTTVDDPPSWARAGTGRQDRLLAEADLVICGGGHGMLAKSLLAGVPVVTVPGGGDQWELANRVVRRGCGELVRPLTTQSLRQACARVLDDPAMTDAARVAAAGAMSPADPVALCRSIVAG